ncbi:MAG: hypothetical protein HRT95_19470, partial [Moritella sp.]|uniref:PHD finger domain-containing protein n=1 Tax=Moritella sp. TaxID=78556 RepID=UPI001D884A65
MNVNLKKEVCGPCKKFVNIGQPILECEICNIAIHTKCYKVAKFCHINGCWTCDKCAHEIEPRYNPFSTIQGYFASDKFYDDHDTYDDNILQQASVILNNCKKYNINDFAEALKTINHAHNDQPTATPQAPQLSSLFLNIDGHASNFDQFLTEIKRLDHNFSIIGLAETNTDASLKQLYNIPNYNSYYQNPIENKHKGSGVALYVHNSLNVTVEESLSDTTPDIES